MKREQAFNQALSDLLQIRSQLPEADITLQLFFDEVKLTVYTNRERAEENKTLKAIWKKKTNAETNEIEDDGHRWIIVYRRNYKIEYVDEE